jgi:hypothetical protein
MIKLSGVLADQLMREERWFRVGFLAFIDTKHATLPPRPKHIIPYNTTFLSYYFKFK